MTRHVAWLLLAILAAGCASLGRPPIGPDTVASLRQLWSTPLKGPSRGAPVADGESLFVTTTNGYLYRFDRQSGAVQWEIDLAKLLGIPGASATKIVTIVGGRVIFGLHNAPFVVALSETTGKPLWVVKVDDHPGAVISQPATVVGDRVFIGVSGLGEEVGATTPPYPCCSFRGSALALDAATGRMLWRTYTMPPGFAGGSIWSGAPLYDPARRAVYVTTGNAFRAPPEVQACLARATGDRSAQMACYPPGVWYDSILALDPETGAVKWGFRAEEADIFTGACLVKIGGYCGGGEDFDFGNGALMWRAGGRDFVGAGQKSGLFWALDPDTGKPVWSTRVGPGGPTGGIEYGSAVEGDRIFVAESDTKQVGFDAKPYRLPSGETIAWASYAALDAATGRILWQTPVPAGATHVDNGRHCTRTSPKEDCAAASAKGAVIARNGVMYGCSTAPDGPLYALDARDGKVLWNWKSGAPCDTRANIVGDRLYWVAAAALHAFGLEGEAAKFGSVRNLASADGLYSTAQAERGKALYLRSCAAGCHNENLSGGGPIPALSGPEFRGRWGGVPVVELLKTIRTTMPKTAPGSLSGDEYSAVLAYLLAANGVKPGAGVLGSDPGMLERTALGR